MKKEIIYNSDLHFEHNQWTSELAFWKDELKTFNNRLEELVNRWTDKEMLAKLEHFQNEFIIHEELVQVFQDDINAHERNMSVNVSKEEDVLDRSLVKKHIEFREKMQTQRHIYAELKKEFYTFLSKYM
jgi:hypothetical protein